MSQGVPGGPPAAAAGDRGPRILFITHESSRTGAPLVLLHLLRWIKANTSLEVEVLSLQSGPLDAAFAEVAPLTVLDTGPVGRVMWLEALARQVAAEHPTKRYFRYLARALRAAKDRRIRRRVAFASEFSLIYANSSVSASVFDYLPADRPPVITHIHELEYGLCYGIPEAVRDQLVRHTSRYIAAAGCVADALEEHLSVPRRQITVHHAFIDGREHRHDDSDYGPPVRQELAIPSNALVVGASGSRDWRKATDLFLLLAARLKDAPTPRPLYFVWVGGRSEGMDEGALRHDIRRLGLGDRVRFVPATSVPDRYFSVFDVFALTSREDPFPLVCLEAALWEVPIVSFDSGGARELIEDGDIGRVLPYADIDAMAGAILELAGDERLRGTLGRAAAEKVARYDVTLAAPRILATIDPSYAVDAPEAEPRRVRSGGGRPPLVAVCVPTYNGARYLGDALASIAAQTLDDYEVVLVDDGSTDDTLSIAERFRADGLPLTIHRNGINQGPALNWNRCLELSEGRWVKFVFQDDLLAPACLERMVEVAEERSNGFVACERAVIYEDDIRAERRNGYEELAQRSLLSGALRGRSELTAIEFATEALTDIDANFVGEPVAVMFDRRIVHRMGGFNPDLIQSVDFEYWLRIGANVGMSYVPEALSTFRVHGGSTTVDNEKTRLFRMTVIDKLLVRAIVLRDPRFAAVRAAAAQRGIDLEATLRAEVAEAEQFLGSMEGAAAAQSRRDWAWALEAYPVLDSRRRRHQVRRRRAVRT